MVTIRPPINDQEVVDEAKRTIRRSFAWLEEQLIERWEKHFFEFSVREEIRLAKPFRSKVPPGLSHLKFRQNAVAGSWYPSGDRRTAGFVSFLPRDAATGFPKVLNVFGAGGNDTLRTCHLLVQRYPKLLPNVLASNVPTLIIFEMSPPVGFADQAQLVSGLLNTKYDDWKFEQRFP